ncbi:hypothetical protein SK128_020526 [Halocaridina rubra]|uniref:Uncharacterized protein n=1 Tax=Halocaridina rubra TaxID=373956 RepID=A0AAN8X0B7_HALRR
MAPHTGSSSGGRGENGGIGGGGGGGSYNSGGGNHGVGGRTVVKYKLTEVFRRYSQLLQVATLFRQVVHRVKHRHCATVIDSRVEEGASTSWLLVLYSPKFAPRSPKTIRVPLF